MISDGMGHRRRIEEVRGATQLSIGPDGPVSLPCDSSETLALLLSRRLLEAYRDDHDHFHGNEILVSRAELAFGGLRGRLRGYPNKRRPAWFDPAILDLESTSSAPSRRASV